MAVIFVPPARHWLSIPSDYTLAGAKKLLRGCLGDKEYNNLKIAFGFHNKPLTVDELKQHKDLLELAGMKTYDFHYKPSVSNELKQDSDELKQYKTIFALSGIKTEPKEAFKLIDWNEYFKTRHQLALRQYGALRAPHLVELAKCDINKREKEAYESLLGKRPAPIPEQAQFLGSVGQGSVCKHTIPVSPPVAR